MQENVLNWLLEEDNPPVRYLTLTRLLGEPEESMKVAKARDKLMDYAVTQAILDHSREFWKDDEKAYWKYTGKYWQVIFLGQFLADGMDPGIREGAEDLIEKRKWVSEKGGQCLTANMLSAFIRLGFGDHPIVWDELEALARRTLEDEGVKCEVMDYSLLPWCYMSTPKLLLCFGSIPENRRSAVVKEAIEYIKNTLVSNEIHNYVPGNNREWQAVLEAAPKRADLPAGQTVKQWIIDRKEEFLAEEGLGERKPKPGWVKFGFPLHYNSDILEAMYALALVHTPMSPKLRKPLEIIKSKMKEDGKWILENSLNGKMFADVEEKGKPSKWITFFALCVLQHFESLPDKG